MAEVTTRHLEGNIAVQNGDGCYNQAFQSDVAKSNSDPPPYDYQQYPSQQPLPGTVQHFQNQETPAVYGFQPHQPQLSPQTRIVYQAPVVIQQVPRQSYCGMITLACFVTWFCNWPFGLAAFILAMQANDKSYDDPEGAKKLGKASMWTSIAGIIFTAVLIAILLGVSFGSRSSSLSSSNSYRTYYYYG